MAATYVAVALGVLGAAELILDPLGLGAARPVIVILVLLGFPFALVLGWAYELHPDEPASAKSEIPAPSKAEGAHETPSIAVLPFRNMSPDPNQDYFCEGVAEEIINALAHLDNLRVIARTSAFAFRDVQEDVRSIGHKLGVDHLLEGSVRKAEGRLRITAQLIHVTDGSHIWSERFDRELADVFEIQDEISLAVVDNLKVTLLAGDRAALTRRSTENTAAYELYLKAQPHFNRWLREGIEAAIDLLRQALLEDPSYGRAYAMLSFCHSGLGFMGHVSPKEAYPKARLAAERALEVDDEIAEAHTALGMVSDHFDWDRAAARRHFQKAIDLSPGYATGHVWYAWYLAQEARFEEGLAELAIAQRLDPLGASFGIPTDFYIGEMLYFARRYEEAIDQLYRTLERDPDFPITHWFLGLALYERDQPDQAVAHLERALEASQQDPAIRPFLACVYAGVGRREDARRILDRLMEQSATGHVPAWDLALVHVGLGNLDLAFDWLEKASEERAGWMVYLKTLPLLDPLREDPRLLPLLDRVGLRPDASTQHVAEGA